MPAARICRVVPEGQQLRKHKRGASHERGSGKRAGRAQNSATGDIVKDLQRLVTQHFQLFGQEIKQELKEAGSAALSLGTGAGLTAMAGLLGIQAVVHILHAVTRLPLWACYAIVAGVLGGAGATFITSGTKQAADVTLVPRQTMSALKEEFTGSPG
jgi:hypothetical protein